MAYTYILQCADGTFYTGSCLDINKRLKQHNGMLKGGAKYTRGRRPVIVVYKEVFETLSEALQREYQIKHLPRIRKEQLLRKNQS